MTITEEEILENNLTTKFVIILNTQRVKAKAQLGAEEVTPKKSFVEEELHFATIPFVGKFENN